MLSEKYTYAHEAILDRKKLELPQMKNTTKLRGTLIREDPLDTEVRKLIGEMLALNHEERPDINQVHQRIKYYYNNGVPPKDGRNKLSINLKPKL